MDLNESFTLVVPTFNRPALLRGLLTALKEQRIGCRVLLLDSSTLENKADNRAFASSLGSQVEWIEFPDDITPQQKMSLGLARVETKYVSFCADDDVIFLDSVTRCVETLEQNPELMGCHGIYLNFSPSKEKVQVHIEYCAPSIVGKEFPARLFRLLARYEAIFYATFRSEHLKKVLSAAAEIDQGMFYEIFTASAAVVFGEVRRIDSMYYARRGGLAPTHTYGHPWYWVRSKADAMFQAFPGFRSRLLTFIEKNLTGQGRAAATDASLLTALYMMFLSASMPALDYQRQQLGIEVGSEPPAKGNPYFRYSRLRRFLVSKIDGLHHKARDWLLGEYVISKLVDGVSFEMQERVNRLVPTVTLSRLANYCRTIESAL
jgi:glycosyltransferase domain-containing protein